MDLKEIRHLAIQLKGDDYYEELRLLENDMEFFNMYVGRNKKSDFGFILIPCQFNYVKAMMDIYELFSFGINYIEEVYDIYTILKSIILDIYDETNKFTYEQIREFDEYLKYDGLTITDYVSGFVGCSHGVHNTLKKIHNILNETDKDKDDERNQID